MTEDFARSAVFTVGSEYTLVMRMPSTPGIPQGVALDQDNVHHGWIRDKSRHQVEKHVKAGLVVKCRILQAGKHWEKYDEDLRLVREWQLGQGTCWIEESDDVEA